MHAIIQEQTTDECKTPSVTPSPSPVKKATRTPKKRPCQSLASKKAKLPKTAEAGEVLCSVVHEPQNATITWLADQLTSLQSKLTYTEAMLKSRESQLALVRHELDNERVLRLKAQKDAETTRHLASHFKNELESANKRLANMRVRVQTLTEDGIRKLVDDAVPSLMTVYKECRREYTSHLYPYQYPDTFEIMADLFKKGAMNTAEVHSSLAELSSMMPKLTAVFLRSSDPEVIAKAEEWKNHALLCINSIIKEVQAGDDYGNQLRVWVTVLAVQYTRSVNQVHSLKESKKKIDSQLQEQMADPEWAPELVHRGDRMLVAQFIKGLNDNRINRTFDSVCEEIDAIDSLTESVYHGGSLAQTAPEILEKYRHALERLHYNLGQAIVQKFSERNEHTEHQIETSDSKETKRFRVVASTDLN